MATNYSINYEDERFKNVENQEQNALNQVNETYNNMINQSNDFYQRQIDAVRDYNTTQQDLQNQQTDLAINEINQAKEKADKDYQREQRGAYSDWQKQSNRYGIEAERQAQNGMSGTGYSESSQVNMYNTYQNRVATARESYNLAVQNYDNKIAEARLANNSRLAEIAFNSLQQELELSLNGFQYKNTLLLDQISKQQDINNMYYTRWQNVLSQMNTENAMAEQIRQYNENMKYQKERDKVKDKQWQKEYNLSKKAYSSSRRSYSSGGRTKQNTTVNLDNNNNNSKTNEGGSGNWTVVMNGPVPQSVVYRNNTPNLSSKKANNFVSGLSKKISYDDLNSKLEKAVKNKQITKNDAKEIFKSYGF